MLRREEWADIIAAHNRGVSIKEICRKSGLSRNTVRKAIRSEKPPEYSKREPSKPDPYKDYLIARLEEYPGLSAKKLFTEIKTMGYEGGITILKDFTLPYRTTRRAKSSIRFETAPRLQAQVDWAELGYHVINGRRIRLSLFVMVLGYSRMLYAELTIDEKQDTFIACHEHAFAYFGGMTEEILYDNAKTVALKHDRDGVVFTPALLDFAYLKGFKPRVCKPARPQTKGKVERAIRYIRDSFLEGESFAGLDDMQLRLVAWLDNTANVRVHNTTGARPVDLLLEEDLIIPRKLPEQLVDESKVPPTSKRTFRIVENVSVESADLGVYERMFA